MHRRHHKWLFGSILVLMILAGCESSGGGRLTSSPALAMPSDNITGSGESTIKATGSIVVDGAISAYESVTAFFADASTGWLVSEGRDSKLTLWHTKDGGAVWSQRGLPGQRAGAVWFTNESKGFAMVSMDCAVNTAGGESCKDSLLSTSDGGRNWVTVWASADATPTWERDQFAFPGGSSGYALTRSGQMLASHDRGRKWRRMTIGSEHFRAQHMSFLTASTGWVVGVEEKTEAGAQTAVSLQVWKTEDAGVHWRRQFRRAGGTLASGGMDFYDRKSGVLLLGNFDDMNGQIMGTTDGGLHWTETGSLRPARPSPMGIRLISPTEGWIPLAVGAGPIDGGLLHFTKGGAKSSTSNDGIWSLQDAVPTGRGTGWAIADSTPGMRPTVLTTANDGKSWKQVWPAPHPIADVMFVDGRLGLGIGRESDPGAFMKTNDGGRTWQLVSQLGAKGVRLHMDGMKHGWVLATKEQGTKAIIRETRDGGVTWRTRSTELPGWGSTPQTAELRFFGDSEGVLAIYDAGGIRVLRSHNGGSSWTQDPLIADDNSLQTLAVFAKEELLQIKMVSKADKSHWIEWSRFRAGSSSAEQIAKLYVDDTPLAAIYPSEHNAVILSDRMSAGQFEAHLLRTQDGGRNWNDQRFPNIAGVEWSTPERFGANGDSSWWLLMRGHLMRTDDAGQHWMLMY